MQNAAILAVSLRIPVGALVGAVGAGVSTGFAATRVVGIYVIPASAEFAGYVGMSTNVFGRLATHVGTTSGATAGVTAAMAARAEVYVLTSGPPSGVSLRAWLNIAEQRMIDSLGGKAALANVVNPIGPARSGLLRYNPSAVRIQ